MPDSILNSIFQNGARHIMHEYECKISARKETNARAVRRRHQAMPKVCCAVQRQKGRKPRPLLPLWFAFNIIALTTIVVRRRRRRVVVDGFLMAFVAFTCTHKHTHTQQCRWIPIAYTFGRTFWHHPMGDSV